MFYENEDSSSIILHFVQAITPPLIALLNVKTDNESEKLVLSR